MSKIISFSHAREAIKENSSAFQATNSLSQPGKAALNSLCSSLVTKENQKRFRAFPESYCREYGLSLEQIHAVTDLDIFRLLNLGASTCNLKKLTATYGLDILDLCAEQTGKTLEEIQQLMSSH